MQVKVRIFGEISRVYGGKHIIEVQENSTVSSVIHKIQENAGLTQSDHLGEWQIGSQELAILINGKNVDLMNGINSTIHEKDDIVITPYVVGG